MIKTVLKTVFQIFLSTLLLFLVLEVIFRFIGAPGASRFAEKVLIQEHLSLQKPKDEYRIFAYGESTMHGSQYGPISNPARWLAVYLKDFLPGRNIRVVNFARIGHGSDFTYETFRDTLPYKPDMAIFYLGHNDFLHGNQKYQLDAEKKEWSYRIRDLIRRSYLISTVYRWVIQKRMEFKSDKSDDRIEFSVIETPPSGIGAENSISPKDPRYSENIQFFRANLSQILDLGAKRGLPMLFYKPVANLKDFAPFCSLHLKDLSQEDLSLWERFFHEGKIEEVQGNVDEALGFYEKAYALDSTYADLSFRLAQIYFKRGELGKAKKLFEEARDNDTIQYRANKDILAVFDEFQKTRDLQLIDTEKVLLPELPGGILGEPLVEDNVHFSIRGHALTGRAAAQAIYERNWIAPAAEWQFGRERSFEAIEKEVGVDRELMLSAYFKMVNYFGSRFENRIRFAKKALEISPNDPFALRHLAWSYWISGDQAKALETYRVLGAVHPEALKEVLRSKPKIQKAFEGNIDTAAAA